MVQHIVNNDQPKRPLGPGDRMLIPPLPGATVLGEGSTWASAILAQLETEGHLILAKNKSSAHKDRQHLDTRLAEISVLFADLVLARYEGGMVEPHEWARVIGYAPLTYSEVFDYQPSKDVERRQAWTKDGMSTLMNLLIRPAKGENDRRNAVLFGVGGLRELRNIEQQVTRAFRPANLAVAFGPGRGLMNGRRLETRYALLWEVFEPEAAWALGVATGDPGFTAILNRLASHWEDHLARSAGPQEVTLPEPDNEPGPTVDEDIVDYDLGFFGRIRTQ